MEDLQLVNVAFHIIVIKITICMLSVNENRFS